MIRNSQNSIGNYLGPKLRRQEAACPPERTAREWSDQNSSYVLADEKMSGSMSRAPKLQLPHDAVYNVSSTLNMQLHEHLHHTCHSRSLARNPQWSMTLNPPTVHGRPSNHAHPSCLLVFLHRCRSCLHDDKRRPQTWKSLQPTCTTPCGAHPQTTYSLHCSSLLSVKAVLLVTIL